MSSRALLVLLWSLSAIVVQAQAAVTINEIRIDQQGSDSDEYFELAGTPNTPLVGLTYLVIGEGSGASGAIEAVVDLTGRSIPESGYFVAAESSFTLGTANLTTDLNFENGNNVTHLLVEGFTGANDDDLDTDDDGILDATPWTSIVDSVALIGPPGTNNLVYSDVTVGPDASSVPWHAYRVPDRTGDWNIGAQDLDVDDTPGACNSCRPIHDIQGSGYSSPLQDQIVTVEAIVVGDFQDNEVPDNGDLQGFYLQETEGDGNDTTSEGIFVFDPNDPVDVEVGDLVQVTGTVGEYFELTVLSSVSDVVIVSSGNPLPAATDISLPLEDGSDLEALEGMLVRLPQALVISGYSNYDRFGEIVLAWPLNGDGRLFQPTAVEEPSSTEAEVRADHNLRSRIILDDGRAEQNPDPARHPNGFEFTLDNRFRGGDTVSNVVGVLDDRFESYRIQPTEGADYVAVNLRPPPPDLAGVGISVASFNVLNYFTTLDQDDNLCGLGFDQECRGADNAEEFERQRAKIIEALAQIDADIVGLIELENNGSAAVADLVEGLNDALGAERYDFIDAGYVGDDVIAVGLIYKPATVTPNGDFAILNSPEFLNPNTPGDPKNRAALAQTFADSASGSRFTVVVNHFKSKGSACGGEDDDPDQGNCNGTRTEAAKVLLDWLATDPTASGDPDILIIGDLNAYDKEDPIVALEEAGYVDLLDYYQDELAYGFAFDGQFGYLDYALANESLSDQVTGASLWHINADEPDILDYDTTFKRDAQDALFEPDNAFRSSDHDPVVVGLDLNAPLDCSAAFPSKEILWPPNHRMHEVRVEGVTDPDGDLVTITVNSVYQDEPLKGRGSGWTGPDAWILDGGARLRAERDGRGNGRVYYLKFTAEDGQGNSCMGLIKVGVPKNRWKGHEPIGEGPSYDSTARIKRHDHHGKDRHDEHHNDKYHHGEDHHAKNHSSWYSSIRDWIERKISNYKSHRDNAHRR
jgi:predicted extracellular nuclease